MRLKIRMPTVAVLMFFVVAAVNAQQSAPSAHAVSQPESRLPADAAQLIQQIEAPQVPYRQGLNGLTLDGVMRHFHTPGVSVAVIKDFKFHWAKGYGVADEKTGHFVQIDTLFQAASISKPVTAMAVLRLVQEGRFSFDDDVNKLLQSWYVPDSDLTRDRPVTPRSLLSHTSGSDDGFGFPGYNAGAPLPSLVQILNGQPPSNVGPVPFKRRPYQAYVLGRRNRAHASALGRPHRRILRAD
jgi:CubicO group peptidase (beta-lactamase class C family)